MRETIRETIGECTRMDANRFASIRVHSPLGLALERLQQPCHQLLVGHRPGRSMRP